MWKKPYILIVGTDTAAFTYFALKFQEIGHGAIAVSNPAQAIRTAAERSPKLVLVDAENVHGDWLETVSALKLNKVIQRLPVFVITDNRLIGTIERMFDAGADAYLDRFECRHNLINTVLRRLAQYSQRTKAKRLYSLA